MPVKKRRNRKNPEPNQNRAIIPTKNASYQKKGTLHLETTGQGPQKRVTSIVTSGKKKRSK